MVFIESFLFSHEKFHWHERCKRSALARHGKRTVGPKETSKMNWDRLQGQWKQISGRMKQHWGRYTDDALWEIDGRRDELVGKIQEAYGISREDAGRQARRRARAHSL
jgi:uncharacterized protein YjbJ (UPF0337 family)